MQYSDIRKKRRAAVMFTMRFSEWTWQNIIVRIVFSLVLGIVIGIALCISIAFGRMAIFTVNSANP